MKEQLKEGDIVQFKRQGFTFSGKLGQILRIDQETVRSKGEFVGHKSSRRLKVRVRRLEGGSIEEVSSKDLEFVRRP